MASKHTYLNHTADIAFDVEADSISELFVESFYCWRNSVVESEGLSATDLIEINLTAGSPEELLVDFINEVNFLLTVKKVLSVEIVRIEINDERYVLNAMMKTQSINDFSVLKAEIKSVTYHQMEIRQENGKYFVRVVFDI